MRNKLLLVCFLVTSCIIKHENAHIYDHPLIGKKIKLMSHAVTLCNSDSINYFVDFKAPLKLISYGDLYCEPCWKKIPIWNKHIDDFKKFPKMSFLCYVQASLKDFESINQNIKLKFPVLLDTSGRFRSVNQIGNLPQYTTFLLNEENIIIMAGDPFLPKIKSKYLKIIESYEFK